MTTTNIQNNKPDTTLYPMANVDIDIFELKKDKIDIVIYHGGCSDGFGSALASYIYFEKSDGKNIDGNTVEYFQGVYGQPPPNVKNKNVLICDFSYDKKTTDKLISDSNSLLIIDHHKTAKKTLRTIPQKNKHFDMNHSGASLTWGYFFPNDPLPLFIRYIEDNDIWLKRMENTDAFCNYYYGLPQEFPVYKELLDEATITERIPIAIAMHKQNEVYIKQALTQATMKFYKFGGEYYMVASCNTSVLKSEIGNKLLSKYPYCDFSAVYSLRDNMTYYSLRSDDTRLDVTKIASKFGGGGHRNASGMTSENSIEIGGKVIDSDITYKFLESDCIEIRDNEYFVRCATNFNVHMMGKYLLQTITYEQIEGGYDNKKSEDDKDDDELTKEEFLAKYRMVQKCCTIIRNKRSNPNYYKFCQASVILSLSVNWEITYTIFWTDDNIFETVKKIFDTSKNFCHCQKDKKAWFTASVFDTTVDIKLNVFNEELKKNIILSTS